MLLSSVFQSSYGCSMVFFRKSPRPLFTLKEGSNPFPSPFPSKGKGVHRPLARLRYRQRSLCPKGLPMFFLRSGAAAGPTAFLVLQGREADGEKSVAWKSPNLQQPATCRNLRQVRQGRVPAGGQRRILNPSNSRGLRRKPD